MRAEHIRSKYCKLHAAFSTEQKKSRTIKMKGIFFCTILFCYKKSQRSEIMSGEHDEIFDSGREGGDKTAAVYIAKKRRRGNGVK